MCRHFGLVGRTLGLMMVGAVCLAGMPGQAEVAVPRMDLEAEDYCCNGKIVSMDGASGGAAVWGQRWYIAMRDLPVPQTSRPVHVWGLVRAQGPGEIRLVVAGDDGILSESPLRTDESWHWVRLPAFKPSQVKRPLMLQYAGDSQAQAWLDRIVLSTEASLEPSSESPVRGSFLAVGRRGMVQAGPFILRERSEFAQEQTKVGLRYDDENLYAVFTCQESCLEPLANRLHEFKADVRSRDDSDIFEDDSVTLLLQPPRSAYVYEVTVNAAGSLLDARCTVPDIWTYRDVSWNSRARVTCTRGNGHWQAELTIPFEDLETTPTASGRWRMLAGRCEQSKGENSAWQPMKGGFHILDNLGEMALVESVPEMVLPEMPTFTTGSNRIVQRSSQPVELASKVTFDGREGVWFRGPEFSLGKSGSFQFKWTVRDPESGRLFFQSPSYHCRVRSQVLSFDASNEVKLAGRPVKNGALLSSGVNALEVRLPFKGTVKVGDLEFQPDRERMTVLVEDSYLWPNRRDCGIWINAGGMLQLLFRPQGVAGFELEDYTLYLDLPEGYRLDGVSGYYKLWKLKVENLGQVTMGKRRLHRHAIRFLDKIKGNKALKSHQYVLALIRAPEKAQSGETLAYHAGSAKAGIVEIPQVLKIHVLPKLAGRQPKTALVQMWTGWIDAVDDVSLMKVFDEHFKAMGVNEVCYESASLRRFTGTGFESWCLNMEPYVKEHPDHGLVDGKGRRSGTLVCPKIMLEDAGCQAYLETTTAAWLKRRGYPEHIDWDYEQHVDDSYLSCYCPRCLKQFGHGKPMEHHDAWTEFMNRRMADMAGLLNRMIKKANPKTLFSVYSSYQTDDSKVYYGIDWNMLADKVDLASCGYGRREHILRATRKALGKTPLVLGEIAYPYEVDDLSSLRNITAPALLRRAADATFGVLIYTYPSMDGRSFDAIGKVSAIMAAYEPFFLLGERHGDELRLSGWMREEYEVLGDGTGARLVLLMNWSKDTRRYGFQLPGFEAASGTLAPGDVKAIYFTRK